MCIYAGEAVEQESAAAENLAKPVYFTEPIIYWIIKGGCSI
jgi:hypothetical protein